MVPHPSPSYAHSTPILPALPWHPSAQHHPCHPLPYPRPRTRPKQHMSRAGVRERASCLARLHQPTCRLLNLSMYTAAAALPVADNSSSRRVRPALGIWAAGGTRVARWCADGIVGFPRRLRPKKTGERGVGLHRRLGLCRVQSVSELGGSIRHHSHSHSLGKVKFRFT